MLSLILSLAIIGQQQIIWIGDKNISESQLHVGQVNAIVFYDQNNAVRLIIINPDSPPGPAPPGPGPAPLPPAPAPPAPIPEGKYGVGPIAYKAVRDALFASKITRQEVTDIVNSYRTTKDTIDSALAGSPTGITMSDAQNKLITKVHDTLGPRLPAWVPVLDLILAHIKTKTSMIRTAQQLGEYYGEIADGMEMMVKLPSR